MEMRFGIRTGGSVAIGQVRVSFHRKFGKKSVRVGEAGGGCGGQNHRTFWLSCSGRWARRSSGIYRVVSVWATKVINRMSALDEREFLGGRALLRSRFPYGTMLGADVLSAVGFVGDPVVTIRAPPKPFRAGWRGCFDQFIAGVCRFASQTMGHPMAKQSRPVLIATTTMRMLLAAVGTGIADPEPDLKSTTRGEVLYGSDG